MDNNKLNTDSLGGELKFADSEKSADTPDVKKSAGADFLKKESKLAEKGRGNVNNIFKKKNKFPLALDIIIAVLAVALVVGAVFGAYYAFVYFSDDSDTVTVEYTILADLDGMDVVQKGKDVYFDANSKTEYFGSIVSVDSNIHVEGYEKELSLVKIRIILEYRADEGYMIGTEKIAVGKELVVRTDAYKYSGTVVELERLAR